MRRYSLGLTYAPAKPAQPERHGLTLVGTRNILLYRTHKGNTGFDM
jgi:hypothetical protein